MVTDQD